jgi:hypothetical protein
MATSSSPKNIAASRALQVVKLRGVRSFKAFVKDDFASGVLGANVPSWRRSTYSSAVAPVSGTQCNQVRTVPGGPPGEAASCLGDHFFGGRPALPQDVTEGYTVWQSIHMYFPDAFSFGFNYGVRDLTTLSADAAAGATSIFIVRPGTVQVAEGHAFRILMTNGAWHFTRCAVGGVLGGLQYTLEDSLPFPAVTGTTVKTFDQAEAAQCGKESDMGDTGIKWLHFTPNSGTRVLYQKIGSEKRQLNQSANSILNYESEVGSGNKAAIYQLPRNQWIAMQMEVKVSANNLGLARLWIDNTLVVESLNINTIFVADGATGLDSWGIGDYWNGVPWTDGGAGRDLFYIDECIVATDMPGYGAPTGVDPAGNVFIDPSTRAGNLT